MLLLLPILFPRIKYEIRAISFLENIDVAIFLHPSHKLPKQHFGPWVLEITLLGKTPLKINSVNSPL